MRRLIEAVIVLAIWTLLTGCATKRVIPDYEVLMVPQPIELYQPGSTWKFRHGPLAAPPESVAIITGPGASTLQSTKFAQYENKISASFTDWVTGALGFSGSDFITVRLGDLRHHRVRDYYTITENSLLLAEVIVAQSFSLTAIHGETVSLSADLIGSKLTKAMGGEIGFAVSDTSSSIYTVTSDRPIVAAIRVIDPGYRLNTQSSRFPLDLSDNAIDRPQDFPLLGYTLTLTGSVDFPSRTARIRINNPASRQFQGVLFQFEGSNTWISPNRTAIQGIDVELHDAVWVWDSISLVWNNQLNESKVNIVRQYINPKTVSSGLRGVR